MDLPDISTTIPIGAAVAISGLIYTWVKIGREVKKSRQKDREEITASILQTVKEEDSLIKAKLEARIEKVDAQLKNLELNVNKDIGHLKETYSAEIRNLGVKIEELRTELRGTHTQLVQLLTTLIEHHSEK